MVLIEKFLSLAPDALLNAPITFSYSPDERFAAGHRIREPHPNFLSIVFVRRVVASLS